MQNSLDQKSSVLFGDELMHLAPQFENVPPVAVLKGTTTLQNPAYIPLNADMLSKHVMLLGGIGTGKSNTFYHIISQIDAAMTSDDVMIIFDTKGDFYKEFYRPGDIVISNDRTATVSYWNIFNELSDGEKLMETAIEISKSLFAEACEKTNQIFFPNAAKDIFMAILLHFMRSVPDEDCTNKELLRYINSTSTVELKAMLESYTDLRAMASYITPPDSQQTQGVISELQQIVREVFIGNFAKDGMLSLKNIVRGKGGKKVFIEYDLGIGKMLSPIYSLMFDLAIKEALSRSRTEGNIYFITDEFKLLPNLTHIDDAVNFGRSLGIKFMIGVQNVEQIYDNYGEERARSIMSGFLTNIAFRVNDAKSREYIQGLYGKNQKIESYRPTIQKNGRPENQREANVVEDWDITSLKIGEAIVGLPGYQPFVFKFDQYTSRSSERTEKK